MWGYYFQSRVNLKLELRFHAMLIVMILSLEVSIIEIIDCIYITLAMSNNEISNLNLSHVGVTGS